MKCLFLPIYNNQNSAQAYIFCLLLSTCYLSAQRSVYDSLVVLAGQSFEAKDYVVSGERWPDQDGRKKLTPIEEKYGYHSKEYKDLWKTINHQDSINQLRT